MSHLAPTDDSAAQNVVHSQKSMQCLVTRAKLKLSSHEEERVVGENDNEGMPPPVIYKHCEDDGARLAETKSLNKLPFKNRNPAL
mmetsp:Transcript_42951/g.52165  ORF Transcript_42951/g.52165 Transcript_42951/m.52165 type:complete len:85 (-) Transcript_42951:135-389(-)